MIPPGEPDSVVGHAAEGTATSTSAASAAEGASASPAGTGRAWLKRFARLWGFALFAVVVAYWFRGVLLPFVLAGLIAYVLAPPVRWLSARQVRGHRVPRAVGVLGCYVLLVGALVGFFVGLMPRLSSDFSRLGLEAPKLWDRIDKDWTPSAARWLERKFPTLTASSAWSTPTPPTLPPVPRVGPPTTVEGVPRPPGTVFTVTPLADGDFAVAMPQGGFEVERLGDGRVIFRPHEERTRMRFEDVLRGKLRRAIAGLEGKASTIIRYTQAVVTGLISGIYYIVLVLMIAAFILLDMDRIHAGARGLVPARYRGEYEVVVAGIDRGLNGAIRGQLLVCLINGILTYIGLLIFHVSYALLLAMFAGMMSLIPIFGSIMSSVPIVAIAIISGDRGLDLLNGVFMLAWILGIHFIEANILSPKILGASARVHPVIVIFALIAGEQTYGVIGALLAVPTAAIVLTLFNYFRSKAWRAEPGAASTPVTRT